MSRKSTGTLIAYVQGNRSSVIEHNSGNEWMVEIPKDWMGYIPVNAHINIEVANEQDQFVNFVPYGENELIPIDDE